MVNLNLIPRYPFTKKYCANDKPTTASLVGLDMANPIESSQDVARTLGTVDRVAISFAPIGETLQGVLVVCAVRKF
jgi:hypothetical protein